MLGGGRTRGVQAGYGAGAGELGLTGTAHAGAITEGCRSCQSLSATLSCRKESPSSSFPCFLTVGEYQR